jgi:HlyD family secretion protein
MRRPLNPTPGADPADFSPALLRIQERPPAPLAGWMLRLLAALVAGVALWMVLGRLDIVAVAEGKLTASGCWSCARRRRGW